MFAKRFLKLALLLCVAFATATEETTELVVIGRILNVRSGPGRTFSIVGQLKNGQLVRYLGTEGLWTKVGEMAYIPSVYALPKDRVKYVDGIATAKPLNEVNVLVNPVYQTTTTEQKVTNDDGTVTTVAQTTTTHLETPVATSSNTNVGVNKAGNTLPIVNENVVVSSADKSHPNRLSTTTAASVLAAKNNLSVITGYASTNSGDTTTSTSTAAGRTLMGVLQSKAVDTSSLKTYTAKHVKSKTVVDSLNNVEAIYDTLSREDTDYTAEEFVKRYYKGTKKIDVALTPEGKPLSGFKLTFTPSVGDLAVRGNGDHHAIVKQVATDVAVLIEQNHKWADKKKVGYYAAKNRRLALRGGIGVDTLGRRYVFYTPV